MYTHICDYCHRPTLSDSFGCEGVGGSGYVRAGFCVTAVDMNKNRLAKYPAPDCRGAERIVGDALWFLATKGEFYELNHTSPPCQGYTRGNAGKETDWPKLIPEVREALLAARRPYVIENVLDAGPELRRPVLLCGCMFGLSTHDADGELLHLQRPRLFETNWTLATPGPCEGEGRPRREHPSQENVAGVYGGSRRAKRRPGESLASVAPRDRHAAKYVRKGGYVPRSKEVAARLLGVRHDTTWQGLKESIPPAYTEYIGRQFMEVRREQAA